MKFTYSTPLQQNENSTLMWYFRILVPPEYAEQLKKPNKRLICTLNKSERIHAALMSDGTGVFFVILNKEVRKRLKVEVGDTISVILEKDTSRYGIAVPEVFKELCELDPEGNEIFHALTIGKQRSLLHLMGKPKSEQKQMEKAFIVFDYLKGVNGELDYKELNIAFRENNRFKL